MFKVTLLGLIDIEVLAAQRCMHSSAHWERRPNVPAAVVVREGVVGLVLVVSGDGIRPLPKFFLVERSLSSSSDLGEEFVGELGVNGGCRVARGFTRDNTLQPDRAIPLGRVLAAYGSFGPLLPRSVTSYGSLTIPEEPQALAAYGY